MYCIDNIENLKGEEWKELEGTEGNYYCSNFGRIKSYCNYNAIIVKPFINDSNYAKIKITQYNITANRFVHRLVASKWLPPPKNIDCIIHHIDQNSLNNTADNLLWVTPAEHNEIHNIMNKESRILTKEETINIIQEIEQ